MKSRFFTTSDRVKLHYLQAGTGSAILFIPGFLTPAEIWQPQLDHFSKQHGVVALDPRSHGKSDKPNHGHYPARLAKDIYETIGELNLPSVVLVAWAFGCSDALTYVQNHGTKQLRGLVLVDGFVGRDRTSERVMSYLEWNLKIQENHEVEVRKFVRSWFKQPHSEEYLGRIGEATLKYPLDSIAAMQASHQVLENQSSVLGTIDVPLMYVGIEEKRDQAEVVRENASEARIEFVDNAGHALFVDQPAEFNRILSDFLTQV